MQSNTRSILHADLDAFYASVEQRDDPRLRGRPMAVGGGVILSASYEARAMGVRTAMNLRQARELCPRIISVPARMDAYTEASRAVFAIFDDISPLVEPISIDEAFLDVTGLRRLVGPAPRIAGRLRVRVREEVGLPITVGVARTKFLAKVASGVGKPDGLLVVPPDGELEFLHPLPVSRLWGVGPKTAAKLAEKDLHTVGEVAALDPAVAVFARELSRTSPPAAVEWADRIHDEPLRRRTLVPILRLWSREDPSAARAWMDAQNMPPELKREFLGRPTASLDTPFRPSVLA